MGLALVVTADALHRQVPSVPDARVHAACAVDSGLAIDDVTGEHDVATDGLADRADFLDDLLGDLLNDRAHQPERSERVSDRVTPQGELADPGVVVQVV